MNTQVLLSLVREQINANSGYLSQQAPTEEHVPTVKGILNCRYCKLWSAEELLRVDGQAMVAFPLCAREQQQHATLEPEADRV